MTSIYDIPYEDIKIFLEANNKISENDAYNETINLLKDKKAKGHTTSIIEWMMAYNLLINKVNIPYYTISDIDNMSQIEINDLAKLLNMKGNNRNNIKNILRYLHKLQDEREFLLPELNNFILNTLTQLETQDIDIYNLNFNDVINLLKTHRNKNAIRKFISDNIEKIIVYKSLEFDISEILKGISYEQLKEPLVDIFNYILIRTDFHNKNITIEIIKDYKLELLKYYDDKEINDFIKNIEKNNEKNNETEYGIGIRKYQMYDLVDFTYNLIKNREIGLAKKVFDIVNELKYFAMEHSYNYFLLYRSIYAYNNYALENIISFMGEDGFIIAFEEILLEETSGTIILFLENITKLEKYDLLFKTIQTYIITNDDQYKVKTTNKILQNLKKAIKSKNDDLILDYINQIYEFMI